MFARLTISALAVVAAPAALAQQSALPTGSGAVQQMPASAAAGASADYRVSAGDLLSIIVYRAPDLQSTLRVGTDGKIEFPSLGRVTVADHTAGEIADLLATELKQRGILVAPSVNVLVSEVRSKTVMVMGAVNRPGEIPLDRPGLTLTSVLAMAGATFGTGSGIVTIMNGPADHREQYRISDLVSGAKDREARPGETLVVQSAPTIYVSGEVGRPGAYPLEPEMTVGQAVAVGGGVTPRGALGRLRLTRKMPDGTMHEVRDVTSATKVQPDDLIYVRQRVF